MKDRIQTGLDVYKDTLAKANKEWEKLEKIMLTSVSGSLALSVTFIRPTQFPVWAKIFFLLSWSFLFLSILGLLLSYIFSELASDSLLNKLKRKLDDEISFKDLEVWKNKFYTKGIDLSNLFAVLNAVFGFLCLFMGAFVSAM